MLNTLFIIPVLGALAVQSQTLGLRSLLSRQEIIDPSVIPAQCEAQCSPVVEALNEYAGPPDPSCGCDATTGGHVDACFACLIEIIPELESSIQEAQQGYEQGCSGNTSTGTAIAPSTDTEATATATADESTPTSNSSSDEPSSEDEDEDDSDSSSNSSQEDPESDTNGASPLPASLLVASGAFALVGLLL